MSVVDLPYFYSLKYSVGMFNCEYFSVFFCSFPAIVSYSSMSLYAYMLLLISLESVISSFMVDLNVPEMHLPYIAGSSVYLRAKCSKDVECKAKVGSGFFAFIVRVFGNDSTAAAN